MRGDVTENPIEAIEHSCGNMVQYLLVFDRDFEGEICTFKLYCMVCEKKWKKITPLS